MITPSASVTGDVPESDTVAKTAAHIRIIAAVSRTLKVVLLKNLFILLYLFEAYAQSHYHAVHRLGSDVHGELRLLGDKSVYSAKQRAAARQHNAVIDDIGEQLGGSFSSVLRIVSSICESGSESASRMSSDVISRFFGKPSARFLPRTSIAPSPS